jgi:hypothetical protein
MVASLVAEWRDLLFRQPLAEFGWSHYSPLCHPDRSVAERRDLLFRQPLAELDGVTTLPFVIPTEA